LWKLRQQVDGLGVIDEEAVNTVGMVLIVPVCDGVEFAVRALAGFDAEEFAQALPARF
jgi:hypothetical protein